MKRILSYYNFIILTLLLIVINLTYHPSFHVARADAEDADVKSVLSRYVLLLSGLLVLPNIRLSKWFRIGVFRKFIAYLIPLSVIALFVNAISPASGIFADCFFFLIPLIFFLLGYQFQLTVKRTMFFSLVYVSFALLTGISQVLTSIGTFVIMEQYMVSAKNSMACIFAVGIAVSLFWALSDIKTYYKSFFWGVFLLLFTVLFTIRGRAGILASVFSCIVIFVKYIKNSNTNSLTRFIRIMVIVTIIIVMLWGTGKLTFVWDYIYESFSSSYSGDITSGRMERNMDAMSLFLDNMLIGRIGNSYEIEWVHNYVLRILSDYGIIVGGYLLIPYFYIIKQVYKNITSLKSYSVYLLGNVAIIVPFVISLFEPTFPYSPGSTIMFAYFLFGVSHSFKIYYI